MNERTFVSLPALNADYLRLTDAYTDHLGKADELVRIQVPYGSWVFFLSSFDVAESTYL